MPDAPKRYHYLVGCSYVTNSRRAQQGRSQKTREQITRECRSCQHQWPQTTGRTGVRRG